MEHRSVTARAQGHEDGGAQSGGAGPVHVGMEDGPEGGGCAEQDGAHVSRGQLGVVVQAEVGGRYARRRDVDHDSEVVQLEAAVGYPLRVAIDAVVEGLGHDNDH